MSYHDTITGVLRDNSKKTPDRVAYRYLNDGEKDESVYTYGDLYEHAIGVANYLNSTFDPRSRVVLAFPSNISFFPALYGSLLSNNIAIPVNEPGEIGFEDRFISIVLDSSANVILTTKKDLKRVNEVVLRLETNNAPTILTIEELIEFCEADKQRTVNLDDIKSDDVAVIQYTSGSTSNPKGVMVTHENIIDNQYVLSEEINYPENSTIVSWLPYYHDMSLMGNIFQAMYVGKTCVQMSPKHFLRRPERWLKAISNYKAIASAAPNFGYEYCVDRIDTKKLNDLDLSNWKFAFNGSEPVKLETLDDFYEKFNKFGFDKKSFTPCYGLAESTLFVSGVMKPETPNSIKIRGKVLTNIFENHSQNIVSCGKPFYEVVIVDDKSNILPEGSQGEIWVKGRSVAKGYWNMKELNNNFSQYTSDSRGPYLKTGDLGFLYDGELYVAGRSKDLIIIRGKNHIPDDIEDTVRKTNRMFSKQKTCVFAINHDYLVVMQEIPFNNMKINQEQVITDIKQKILMNHGLNVREVIFLRRGKLPKTSSGKIKRFECKEMYLNSYQCNEDTHESNYDLNKKSIEEFLSKLVSVNYINGGEKLASLGLDSLKSYQLQAFLSEEFNLEIPALEIMTQHSINSLLEQSSSNTNSKEEGERQGIYELSYGQKSLWFLDELNNDNYLVISRAFKIKGDLDLSRFSQSVKEVITNNPTLRVKFKNYSSDIMQEIQDVDIELIINTIDWSSIKYREERAQKLLKNKINKPIKISEDNPLNILDVKFQDTRFLVFKFHHMVIDFWSMRIFLEELKKAYEGEQINEKSYPYDFFVEKQKNIESNYELRKFWGNYLHNSHSKALIPHEKNNKRSNNAETINFKISNEITDRLIDMSKNEKISLFSILYFSFNVVIHKLTGDRDLLMGVTTHGRDDPRFINTIGYFVNTLPIITTLENNTLLEELIRKNSNGYSNALRHQAYPLSMIAKQQNMSNNPIDKPLFDILFTYHDSFGLNNDLNKIILNKQGNITIGSSELEYVPLEDIYVHQDIDVAISKSDDGLSGYVRYRPSNYTETNISNIVDYYISFLEQLPNALGSKLEEISLLSANKKSLFLERLNENKKDYSESKLVHQFIEDNAENNSQSIAIKTEESSITYKQLDEISDKISSLLKEINKNDKR